MPCRYVIDPERRLIITTGWDRVTFFEAKAHQDQLATDPEFDPEFNQLVDGTAITALDISTDQARLIAARRFFSPRSRRAFLANGLSVLAIGRLMEGSIKREKQREQVALFHDRDEALQWLGAPAPVK